MATACLMIGWNRPVPEREAEAWEFLQGEGLQQIERYKREGWCDGYEIIGLTPHMSALNSFALLKGARAKLDELRRTDDFERFSMRLSRLMTSFGVTPGVTLEGIRKVAERNGDLLK